MKFTFRVNHLLSPAIYAICRPFASSMTMRSPKLCWFWDNKHRKTKPYSREVKEPISIRHMVSWWGGRNLELCKTVNIDKIPQQYKYKYNSISSSDYHYRQKKTFLQINQMFMCLFVFFDCKKAYLMNFVKSKCSHCFNDEQ